MIYAPSDLKAFKLRDVPAGTIISFTHIAEDFPCVIKLADNDGCNSWILSLAGKYAFHVIPWSNDGEVTTPLCKPDEIRFKLGTPSFKHHYNTAGVLTLHRDGACIATSRNGQTRSPKVDVASWGFVQAANIEDGCAIHPGWEIGYVDAKHDFIPIFSRTEQQE